MHYSFRKDLKDGDAAQNEVVARLQTRPWFQFTGANFDKAFDIQATVFGKPMRLEVKYDLMSAVTKNIAIEYHCNGNASGILATKAPVWAFKYYKDRFRLVYTDTLLKAYVSDEFPMTRGGDNNKARMFLVPLKTFETWGVAF